MGSAKFAGHFGSTHPAGKFCPKDETVRGPSDRMWYIMKKYHNRKSRYWFRAEIRRIVKGEKHKL